MIDFDQFHTVKKIYRCFNDKQSMQKQIKFGQNEYLPHKQFDYFCKTKRECIKFHHRPRLFFVSMSPFAKDWCFFQENNYFSNFYDFVPRFLIVVTVVLIFKSHTISNELVTTLTVVDKCVKQKRHFDRSTFVCQTRKNSDYHPFDQTLETKELFYIHIITINAT
jgi:hypothetical protein